MARQSPFTSLRIDPQGRVVIPAVLRHALGVGPGDTLIASLEDHRVVLETRDAVIGRIREMVSHIPPTVSLVDELIEERRAESRREGAT